MKKKKFDCVEMKRKIQKQILNETKGLSQIEKRRKLDKKILSDPILGPIWKKLNG